jgi:hypothetical protein
MISKQALGMEGMENQECTQSDEKTSFSLVSMYILDLEEV